MESRKSRNGVEERSKWTESKKSRNGVEEKSKWSRNGFSNLAENFV